MGNKNNTYFKGYAKQPITDFNGIQPLDAASVKILKENLDNLYFGHFQVRCSDSQQNPIRIQSSGGDPGDARRRLITSLGPFPVTIQTNGKPAPLYVEVLASSSGQARISVVARAFQNSISPTNEPLGNFSLDGTMKWVQMTDARRVLILDPLIEDYALATRLNSSGAPLPSTANVVFVCIDVFAIFPNSLNDTVSYQGIEVFEVAYDVS